MRKAEFEMFPDKKGEWRWRFKAPNGGIMGDSGGDGYKRPSGCERAIARFRELVSSAKVIVRKK